MTEFIDQTDVQDAASFTKDFCLADLPPRLQDAATRLNWAELMPVQTQTIPYMLAGQDVMVQSQTGSGKTGAFLLPILARIDTELGAPQALILAPTRELAVQVVRDAEALGQESRVRALAIYGGVGYKLQIDGLEAGAQLIIGTPGRILDHLLKGTLNLDRLKILVFDEADRMLSMGFYPDMKQLQRYLPRGLQSAMFSATYPGHVKRLAGQFLKAPVFVSLSHKQVHASDVLHVVYKVPAMQKSRILVKIIEQENPASAIIFCNTKADVHFVAVVLRRFGYDVGEISADLTQTAREDVLEKLRLNKLRFLVATDVAARGIDIHELSHVFQYQPPQDHEAYVHRTGRTGRAGAAGVAISLVSGMEEIELEQIAKKFDISLEERESLSDEDLEILVSQRAIFLLEARLRKADNIQRERMQRFARTVGEVAGNEEGRVLLAMLVDEFYQSTFHAPLEQPAEKLMTLARSRTKTSVPAPVESVRHRAPGKKPQSSGESIPVDVIGMERREMPEPELQSGEETISAAQAASDRSEGEKRRRRRPRKKTARPDSERSVDTDAPRKEPDAGNASAQSEVVPAPVVPQRDVPPPATPQGAVSKPVSSRKETMQPEERRESDLRKADDQGPEVPGSESVESAEGSVAPKKRRRRRPRKKSETAHETASETPVSGGASVDAPVVEKPRQKPPIPRENAAKPRDNAETTASDRGRGKSEKVPPNRPVAKKKIFLE